MQEGNERSKREHRFDGATEIYVTGPSWPSAATVNVNDVNPWSKQHWNLTLQGQVYKRDRDKAMRMAQAAGHKDALSARVKNARSNRVLTTRSVVPTRGGPAEGSLLSPSIKSQGAFPKLSHRL